MSRAAAAEDSVDESSGGRGEEWPCEASEYDVERLIGRGSFGKVYTARCISKRVGEACAVVALKVLDLDAISSEMASISREVQMMRLCRHANVLSIYASFVHSSLLYVVMPLMDKGSCAHVMAAMKERGLGEGMSEPWIGVILKQVGAGLEYLHANGFVHRDVKASNVLLDSSARVALADFGVSSWLVRAGRRRSTATTFVGTPCWMAPEVMEQVDGYDYKADIWSLGITALELAKGFAPYAYLPPMKVLLLTIQDEPPSLRSYATEKSSSGDSFSRAFKETVRMCLQKEARKRPTVSTLLNSKFFKTDWPRDALKSELLDNIPDIAAAGSPASPTTSRPRNNYNDDDDAKKGSELRTPQQQQQQQHFGGAVVGTTPGSRTGHDGGQQAAGEGNDSGDYAKGTTWTFDDGHQVILKSESYIRREIDARSAQDARECEAIFDDVESLMSRRGGEWDFKKNHDVTTGGRDRRPPP